MKHEEQHPCQPRDSARIWNRLHYGFGVDVGLFLNAP
jgi:hypothetical protein